MNDKKTVSQLKFTRIRPASETEYSVYRCEGALGCGERITEDVVNEHAAKQHHTYDYLKVDGTATTGVSIVGGRRPSGDQA